MRREVEGESPLVAHGQARDVRVLTCLMGGMAALGTTLRLLGRNHQGERGQTVRTLQPLQLPVAVVFGTSTVPFIERSRERGQDGN